ncbi:Clp protease N-terminal domain-containing protein [Streptomyces sp. NPDC091272]|uniref:Clp protease N-terminal domain-containing protein n=1 Tax=Streptomyces sp. NPDC091272 TaxID=3365981 RepID=UPI00381D8F5C
MHDPVRRVSGNGEAVPPPAGVETGLTAEMATVVVGARRRAQRDGDPQIDTAHLLHALMESDPDVRAAFESGAQVARVLGYLVQRSIGYGLRWQARVEGAPGTTPVAGWSPAAVAAMEAASARAAERGSPGAPGGADALGGVDVLRSPGAPGGAHPALGTDLLAALAGNPECRAVEVLRRAGVEPARLTGQPQAVAVRET